jgi:AcrR family transcriptional regulator
VTRARGDRRHPRHAEVKAAQRPRPTEVDVAQRPRPRRTEVEAAQRPRPRHTEVKAAERPRPRHTEVKAAERPRRRAPRVEVQAAQRRRLVEAAARLLAHEGPDALSLRRLARAVGASTSVAYTLFGGKDGLVKTLQKEGFERLGRAFDRASRGADPLRNLRALAFAYRGFALAEPVWFSLVAGRALSGAAPLAAGEVRASRAWRRFTDEVRGCIAAKIFPRGEAEAIADGLWGLVHGLAGLELAGYFPDRAVAESRFARALAAAATGYATARSAAARARPRR